MFRGAPRASAAGGVVTNLERQLTQLVDGRITFTAFRNATRREYEKMATYLMRRWIPPSWCVLEDVVQELYLGTWIWTWEWQDFRGPSLSRFVVFNAMAHAKRALHKARGAKLSGSQDRNPSHIERPLSSYGVDGEGDAMAELLLAEDAIAETKLVQVEERKASVAVVLGACETTSERIAILAIAEAGDVDGGGALLYDDLDARLALRLASEEHAARFIARVASGVVERLEMSSAS
jgi:hypothetical protein